MTTAHLVPGERVMTAEEARTILIRSVLDKLNADPEEVREARRVRYERARYRNKLRVQRYTRHHLHNGRKPSARRKR